MFDGGMWRMANRTFHNQPSTFFGATGKRCKCFASLRITGSANRTRKENKKGYPRFILDKLTTHVVASISGGVLLFSSSVSIVGSHSFIHSYLIASFLYVHGAGDGMGGWV
jgi:hypothetical protein